MNNRSAYVGLAAVVVLLCIVGTVTIYALGNAMDDDKGYPSYSVTGTGPDGVGFTGTATCMDTHESEIRKVLRFDYSVELEDGKTTTFQSYLFLDADGLPNDSYTQTESGEQNTTLWQHRTDGSWYLFSDAKNLLWFTFEVDGYSGTATVVT